MARHLGRYFSPCHVDRVLCAARAQPRRKTLHRSETWRARRRRTKPTSRWPKFSRTMTCLQVRQAYPRHRRRFLAAKRNPRTREMPAKSSLQPRGWKNCNPPSINSLRWTARALLQMSWKVTNQFSGARRMGRKIICSQAGFVEQTRFTLEKAKEIAVSGQAIKDAQDMNDPRVKSISAKLDQLVQATQRNRAAFQAVVDEGKALAGNRPHNNVGPLLHIRQNHFIRSRAERQLRFRILRTVRNRNIHSDMRPTRQSAIFLSPRAPPESPEQWPGIQARQEP